MDKEPLLRAAAHPMVVALIIGTSSLFCCFADAKSCAEVGACIFVEATKGQIGMDDRKALGYFKKAAEGGEVDGMFMYALCLYYGIGNATAKPNKQEAYNVIQNIKSGIDKDTARASKVSSISSNGWIVRRLKEAAQMKQ